MVGSGRPLLFDTGWVSDLEAMWDHDGYRGLVEQLALSNEVICFDPPGTGLSDRDATTSSIDEEVELLRSVLEAVGVGPSRQVSMFCSSIAASTAIRFAALEPGLVQRMVLFGGTLRGDALVPDDARQALLSLIRAHWGLGSKAMRDIFIPGLGSEDWKWFDSWQRQCTDGETAALRLQMYYESDVSSEAAQVRAPTLVLHRVDDQAVRFSNGAAMAAAIAGATLEPVDGAAHLCFLGDWRQVADLTVPFFDVAPEALLPKGPYGEFTARELDVAELTTLGLTNAAIGERLGISPRTVESHLGRIRYKLGVRTRAEVAAWMARRTEVS